VQREGRARDLLGRVTGERWQLPADALERSRLARLVGVEQVFRLLFQVIDVGAGR
jgi:hypothetical protein